jgi:hypothetical protein
MVRNVAGVRVENRLRVKKKKDKIHVQAMNAYRGIWGIAPLSLNFGTRWSWVVKFTPLPVYARESTAVPVE